MKKSKKSKLPYGALKPKHWNVKPERTAAFYTFQSQRYFQTCIQQYVPEVYPHFQTLVEVLEIEAENNKFTGWKALAHQWCQLLNALVFHEESQMYYHTEANELICNMYSNNFGVYHRALNIASIQMDNCSFKEALGMWRALRKEQADDFRYFSCEYGDWEWVTPNKLIDCNTREVVAEMDDTYWIELEPNPSRDYVPVMSIPMIGGGSTFH